MATAEIKIEGMTCEGCVKSVSRTLAGVPGVTDVNVSLAQASAKVTYDPQRTGVAELKKAVQRAGYESP
jgi:copper chaperone